MFIRSTQCPNPIDATRRHVDDRPTLRAQDTQILAELLLIGRAVPFARRDVVFPIEYNQVAVLCPGDRVRPPGDLFAVARGTGAVERHFRNEKMTERLQFGERECA